MALSREDRAQPAFGIMSTAMSQNSRHALLSVAGCPGSWPGHVHQGSTLSGRHILPHLRSCSLHRSAMTPQGADRERPSSDMLAPTPVPCQGSGAPKSCHMHQASTLSGRHAPPHLQLPYPALQRCRALGALVRWPQAQPSIQ